MTDYPLIVWERADGGISITAASPKQQLPGESEQVFLDRIAAVTRSKHPGLKDAPRLENCPADKLPHPRVRDCWRNDSTGKIQVDMPLARKQRMSEIRTERNNWLQTTDGLMARANEIGDSAEINSLKTMRQELRDLTNNIETDGIFNSLTKPEELDGFQPDWPENMEG